MKLENDGITSLRGMILTNFGFNFLSFSAAAIPISSLMINMILSKNISKGIEKGVWPPFSWRRVKERERGGKL